MNIYYEKRNTVSPLAEILIRYRKQLHMWVGNEKLMWLLIFIILLHSPSDLTLAKWTESLRMFICAFSVFVGSFAYLFDEIKQEH
jgi:hypothetical protein